MLRQKLQAQRRKARILPCVEDFSYGPLVPTRTLGTLLRLRYRHWLRSGYGRRVSYPDDTGPVEIHIAETGSEQLMLIVLTPWLRDCVETGRNVQIMRYPSTRAWQSLAMIRLDTRASPLPVDLALLDRLGTIRAAVTAATPDALFALHHAGCNIPALPHLDRAIADLVSFYPQLGSGLTLAQHRLLTECPNDWVPAAKVVGMAMAALDEGPIIGDGILFETLRRMSGTAVDFQGDTRKMRSCEVHLTDLGAACLRGESDLIDHAGLDLRVGGVHLDSTRGALWYRDAQDRLHRT